MKRMLVSMAAAAVLAAMAAGTARADPKATHIDRSFSGQETFPAGTLCDFDEQETVTVVGHETIAPNGQDVVHLTLYITHTNLDTGYALTETDETNAAMQLSKSTYVTTGIFWHLRDPNGKVVLVKAGEATIDFTTGELIKFTPNSAFDQSFEDIICPALGGSPA
jgi:hypothetical protein